MLVGLANTLWTLLVSAFLLFNSYAIGIRCLRWVGWDSHDSSMHLILGLGIGLGCLGMLGLGFSVVQLSTPWILASIQISLTTIFLFAGDHRKFKRGFGELFQELNLYAHQLDLLAKPAILLIFIFSFALTLAPQFEAFDALLYHLTQPARILQDGGLGLINIPHFWFPNITENTYLWALALNAERTAQIIHYTWGILSVLILFLWATRTWSGEIGSKTILLLATIPSLLILASWAYADMALCYYTTAALFLLSQYKTVHSTHSFKLLGIVCGLAMGVKYTSFVLPLTCGLLLLIEKPLSKAIHTAAQFSVISILVALPWYFRNAIFMRNPFYPFAFGGRYWDSFLADWFAGKGTGIGWDFIQIIRLPLDATLGYRDANYFDGQIGPVFLILFPATLWILLTAPRRDLTQTWSLISIGAFASLSATAWTLGVVNSAALWQARLFYPALLPLAIPSALGWHALTQLNTPRLHISFLVNAMISIVIALTIFDSGAFVLARNPLAFALGAQTREQYIEHVAPSYAELMQAMDGLPTGAIVYSLFEPRSYNLPRPIQPDAILSNFAHDLYLFRSTDTIIERWKMQGYTHILVYERGLQFMLENNPEYLTQPALEDALAETLSKLQFVSQTPDKVYSIYAIP